MVDIVKKEAEENGIVQKYYASNAAIFVPDLDRTPEQIGKKLICSMKEWLRSTLSALKLHGHKNKSFLRIDSDTMEELAEDALRKMTAISRKYEKEITSEDREFILSRIHERMLSDLMRETRWSKISIRSSK
ncbi:MAG: hypothetical protein ACUVTL_11070 [Thermoproteota archaeon]